MLIRGFTPIFLGTLALVVVAAGTLRPQEPPSHSQDSKTSNATASARPHVGNAVNRNAAPVVGKGNPAEGKKLFAQHCQTCHEPESNKKKVGPGLKGLFHMPAHKMPDGTVMSRHDEPTIRKQIEDGSRSMPSMKGVLSKPKIDNLIAYLRTL